MAASATFALKAGLCVRRARLAIVAPDLQHSRRSQADFPLIGLSEFARPPLTSLPVQLEMDLITFHRRDDLVDHRSEDTFARFGARVRVVPHAWQIRSKREEVLAFRFGKSFCGFK
jgi:hypothetical protein